MKGGDKMENKQITMRLDEDVIDLLKSIKKAEGRSYNGLMKQFLTEWILKAGEEESKSA